MKPILKTTALTVFAASMVVGAVSASAAPLYVQGFEANTSDWSSGTTRVASGNNGINSADGAYHAEVGSDYTYWGGSSVSNGGIGQPFQAYSTSLDIFLDSTLPGDDVRFDWTSAIRKLDGTHLRDFVFNAGLYNNADGNGNAGFIVSAGNSAGRGNSYPKNPGHDPFTILNSGWYTFQNNFYDNGGTLAVDLSIFDAGGTELNSWTLSDSGDLISGVGGSYYGWFANNEFNSPLAIDNAELRTTGAVSVPEPATFALLGLGLAGISFSRRRGRT